MFRLRHGGHTGSRKTLSPRETNVMVIPVYKQGTGSQVRGCFPTPESGFTLMAQPSHYIQLLGPSASLTGRLHEGIIQIAFNAVELVRGKKGLNHRDIAASSGLAHFHR